MCVAVVIEANTPTQHELWQMHSYNPDGAGIAWCDGNVVKYRKGLAWTDVVKIGPMLPKPWLLHFRWATHGGKIPRLTHPFPLGHKALSNWKLTGKAEAVLIHNGTWSKYKKHVPSKYRRHDTSDTAVAAYVAGTKGEEILDEVTWATAVMRAAGDGRVDITLRGDWEQHEGNSYSNLLWHWGSTRKAKADAWSFSEGWESDDHNKPYAVKSLVDTYPRSSGSTWVPEIAKRTPYKRVRGEADETCETCGEKWYFYHKCRVSGEVLISD